MMFLIVTIIVVLGIILDFARYPWIASVVYLIAFAVIGVLSRAGKAPSYINAEFEEMRAEIVGMRVEHDETNAELSKLRVMHEETKAGVHLMSAEYRIVQERAGRLAVENARLLVELEKERTKVKQYEASLPSRTE